jgi:hypothetical protein
MKDLTKRCSQLAKAFGIAELFLVRRMRYRLFQLFFVTLMPFSMIVAGRYGFAPAIWLYGANMVF